MRQTSAMSIQWFLYTINEEKCGANVLVLKKYFGRCHMLVIFRSGATSNSLCAGRNYHGNDK